VDNGIAVNGLTDGQTVDDSTLRSMLDGDIARAALKAPNRNSFYLVFTPPNVTVTDGGQDSVHNFFGYHDVFTSSAGLPVYYAVIAHPIGNGDFQGLNDFQTLTRVVSHELAEGVTDPNLDAWYDDQTGDEIGDLANGPDDAGFLNGYVVQAEWSARAAAVVLPADAQPFDSIRSPQEQPLAGDLDAVAKAFTHSDEYFSNLVANDYQQLLGRTPSAKEISGWVNALEQGATDEQVLAAFVSSPEYYQRAGGTDQAWLGAVYHDLLGRAADAWGENVWQHALATGTSRSTIAYSFAVSSERETLVITHDYQQYLGRAPVSAEIAGWVTAFRQGATNEQIAAGFVASGENFQAHDATIEGWLTGAYQSLLGRAPDKTGFDYWDVYLEDRLV